MIAAIYARKSTDRHQEEGLSNDRARAGDLAPGAPSLA